MNITASQLQSHHKALIDALKRGEKIEITYHGQVLGVVHPVTSINDNEEQQAAMANFFGMHRDLSVDTVEDELRAIRKGRRNALSDL
jgi:antitoxin (DNA-binding transcriptional repressor) of toxin-antitoxin stability system